MSRETDVRDLLARVAGFFHPAVLASSLSIEDMVLTDLISRERLPIGVFVLDTECLHGDTLELVIRLERRYSLRVKVYQPDPQAVSAYVVRFGRDAFYESADLRRQCCAIRKVAPLRRALDGKQAWITGMRREQSSARRGIALQERDDVHGLMKFSPLADWSEAEVWEYIRRREVPYNPLYDRGYRPIGCAPCTRPVAAGEAKEISRALVAAGKSPGTPVVVIENASLPSSRRHVGTLGTLERTAARSAGGPVLILLGEVYRQAAASQIIAAWTSEPSSYSPTARAIQTGRTRSGSS